MAIDSPFSLLRHCFRFRLLRHILIFRHYYFAVFAADFADAIDAAFRIAFDAAR